MMTIEYVRSRLEKSCDALGSQKAFAAKHGISQPYINDVLLGRREPGEKILRALKMKKVVGYVYALLLILLLVGVAEAQQDIYTDCLHKAPDGTTYDICRMPDLRKILRDTDDAATKPNPKMWYVDPQLGVMFTSPCEQKMKEAMRMADQYLPRDGQALSGATLEYCDNVCQAEKVLKQARDEKAMLRKWHDTMKECVK